MEITSLKNSVVLITGGTGSWGNELVSQLLRDHEVKEIRVYSRGEHKQVEMRRKFQDKRLRYFIGDVRDKNRLLLASKNVDYVFHLAALKHVPVCEENPWEAVLTNIIGTQNVIEAAIENKVKKVIDVSTDKAVDPFNLYGVSKACGEKLIIAANTVSDNTKFVCIRGGNVLGTNGSVIPLFKEQIAKANVVTITDERMTRFLMRVEEAVGLVLHATNNSVGGEVFVMKMPACKITELAKVMIDELGNKETKMTTIGVRPGEKIYEVLVSKYESSRAYDLGDYYMILPQIAIPITEKYYEGENLKPIPWEEFNSNNTKILALSEIKLLLEKDGWFDGDDQKEALEYLNKLSKENLQNFFQSENWIK